MEFSNEVQLRLKALELVPNRDVRSTKEILKDAKEILKFLKEK